MTNGTRRGWGVSVTPQQLFSPGKDPVPVVQEAEWAPGPVWTVAENLASTGFLSPDRPARSQSLYRLSYPAHRVGHYAFDIVYSRSETLVPFKQFWRNVFNNKNTFTPVLKIYVQHCSEFYPDIWQSIWYQQSSRLWCGYCLAIQDAF